jgi:AcrR family transcriptional regulator
VTDTKSRRRGTQLEQAILDAAWAELSDVGYAAFTIEAVAARAATSKPVIYRRWANRAELVLAAWNNQTPFKPEPIDTGELRSDLIALFSRVGRRAGDIMSEMIAGVMGEAFRHPEVATILKERLRSAPLSDIVEKIVNRAVDRGELPPLRLPPVASRLPLNLIRSETMVCGEPLSEESIAELVDDVYLPLLHGLARTP